MKRFLLFLAIASVASSCHESVKRGDLDLKGQKGITIFFLLGSLDEYLGRHIIEGGDHVEGFYCSEQDKARIFRKYLEKLVKEQGIKTSITEEKRQECLTLFRSLELTELFNSFYEYKLTSGTTVQDRNGKWKKTATAFVTKSIFDGVGRDCKLAYLSGAYWRYGPGAMSGRSFRFANSYRKVDMIADLLREFGCRNVRVESDRRGIPASNTIAFKPTREVEEWFSKPW
jgi:hypothetical protein